MHYYEVIVFVQRKLLTSGNAVVMNWVSMLLALWRRR